MLRAVLKSYTDALVSRPFISRALTTAASAFVGDALCQSLIERKRVSWARSLKAFALGLCVLSPQLYVWHQQLLPRLLQSFAPRWRGALVAVALDQLLFSPVMVLTYLLAVRMDEDGNWDRARRETQQRFPGLLATNMCFWPFASYLNFRFAPLKFRLLVLNAFGLLWNVVSPYFARKTHHTSSRPRAISPSAPAN